MRKGEQRGGTAVSLQGRGKREGETKRSPRDPRSRSRGLKSLQDRPRRLEKNTIPKTIVHINVADVAEIDKDKTLLTRRAGRAAVFPLGRGNPPPARL